MLKTGIFDVFNHFCSNSVIQYSSIWQVQVQLQCSTLLRAQVVTKADVLEAAVHSYHCRLVSSQQHPQVHHSVLDCSDLEMNPKWAENDFHVWTEVSQCRGRRLVESSCSVRSSLSSSYSRLRLQYRLLRQVQLLPDTCRNQFWKLQTNTTCGYRHNIKTYISQQFF